MSSVGWLGGGDFGPDTHFDVFCVKQKTAYEMRSRDWSSDMCSSDLLHQWSCAWRRRRTVHVPPLRQAPQAGRDDILTKAVRASALPMPVQRFLPPRRSGRAEGHESLRLAPTDRSDAGWATVR